MIILIASIIIDIYPLINHSLLSTSHIIISVNSSHVYYSTILIYYSILLFAIYIATFFITIEITISLIYKTNPSHSLSALIMNITIMSYHITIASIAST